MPFVADEQVGGLSLSQVQWTRTTLSLSSKSSLEVESTFSVPLFLLGLGAMRSSCSVIFRVPGRTRRVEIVFAPPYRWQVENRLSSPRVLHRCGSEFLL